jgi:hypothetical protein
VKLVIAGVNASGRFQWINPSDDEEAVIVYLLRTPLEQPA